MNDMINIKLQMAGSIYPLTIHRKDEEIVRLAAKKVESRFNAYRSHYEELSLERIFPMVAFQFAKEVLELKERNDTEPFTTKIQEWGELLEEQFKQK